MTSLSTTALAKKIRSELKENGYNRNMVSVRKSNESAINVEVLDQSIDKEVVSKIAKKYESIDRDQFGEVLSGGNTFIFVS